MGMYADASELTAVAIQNHRTQLAQRRLSLALNHLHLALFLPAFQPVTIRLCRRKFLCLYWRAFVLLRLESAKYTLHEQAYQVSPDFRFL
jgi:hypothetical protein